MHIDSGEPQGLFRATRLQYVYKDSTYMETIFEIK